MGSSKPQSSNSASARTGAVDRQPGRLVFVGRQIVAPAIPIAWSDRAALDADKAARTAAFAMAALQDRLPLSVAVMTIRRAGAVLTTGFSLATGRRPAASA